MRKNTIVLGGAVIILVVVIWVLMGYFKNSTFLTSGLKKIPPVNPALKIAHSLFGKVQKVEGDKLVINQEEPIASNSAGYTDYEVYVPNTTPIFSSIRTAFFFKPFVTAPLNKLSTQDIKIGQYIYMETYSDFIMGKTTKVEASKIHVLQKISTLTGIIEGMEGQVIVLKAQEAFPSYASMIRTAPKAKSLKDVKYQITIMKNTELSQMIYPSFSIDSNDPSSFPKQERLALEDLKLGMRVKIYTDGDVLARTKLNALRVEPITLPPLPTPTLPPGASFEKTRGPAVQIDKPIPTATLPPYPGLQGQGQSF